MPIRLNPRLFSHLYLIILLTGCAIVVALNYFIDPLWCFGIPNKCFTAYPDIDSRLQKTNRITFGDGKYDTLILGSSRTEHISQYDLVGYHAFNYAVPSFYPQEISSYVNYFKQANHGTLKTIVIGLDFFGTNINGVDRRPNLNEYLAKYNDPLYRYKLLISIDTLKYSIKVIRHDFFKVYYDRYNNKLFTSTSRKLADADRVKQTNLFSSVIKNYIYDNNYKNVISNLKNSNPNCRIIVFTTPVSEPYFRQLTKNHFDSYEQWLRDVVKVFGGVYNFMYINSVTSNLDNYADLHHFYPYIGTMITKKICGKSDASIPADFGVYITKDSIDDHLRMVKQQITATPH